MNIVIIIILVAVFVYLNEIRIEKKEIKKTEPVKEEPVKEEPVKEEFIKNLDLCFYKAKIENFEQFKNLEVLIQNKNFGGNLDSKKLEEIENKYSLYKHHLLNEELKIKITVDKENLNKELDTIYSELKSSGINEIYVNMESGRLELYCRIKITDFNESNYWIKELATRFFNVNINLLK